MTCRLRRRYNSKSALVPSLVSDPRAISHCAAGVSMQMSANNLHPPVKDQHLLLSTNSFAMGGRLSIKCRLYDQTEGAKLAKN